MTVFIAFLAVLAAFAGGFLSGLSAVPPQRQKAAARKKEDEELLRLRRELQIFFPMTVPSRKKTIPADKKERKN